MLFVLLYVDFIMQSRCKIFLNIIKISISLAIAKNHRKGYLGLSSQVQPYISFIFFMS